MEHFLFTLAFALLLSYCLSKLMTLEISANSPFTREHLKLWFYAIAAAICFIAGALALIQFLEEGN